MKRLPVLFFGALVASPEPSPGIEHADAKPRANLPALKDAAAKGDVHAARAVGLMLTHGEAPDGSSVPADTVEGLRYLRSAAAGGDEVARFVLRRLNRGAAAARAFA